MYALQLWREYKLSLAEIYAFFPKIQIEYVDKNICILDTHNKNLLLSSVKNMWWIIKLIELTEGYSGKYYENIFDSLWDFDGKYRFWLSILWEGKNLKELLMKTKKCLKEKKISARFVNKNFWSLTSAQIIWENLIEREADFNLIITQDWTQYFWKTIWIQDIGAYSKRDYGKTRDMEVGMLPPKLAQIMINISGWKRIYDPFCGLGTVLIESILMGNTEVYGSDISAENIEKTKLNIEFAKNNFTNNLTKSELKVLDARGISSSPYLKYSDVIVTEGYLGQIFQKYSITEKKIVGEKEQLLDIYSHFFEWLKRAKYQGNIVISFPFWEIRSKYFYFSEIYAIIKKYCDVQTLLPNNIEIKATKLWSLLYKRENQTVGREIFKLKMK